VPHRSAAGLIAGLAALLVPAGAGAVTTLKVGDFPSPTFVTAPPKDPHRLFVVEKDGRIELLHDGTRKEFLDIGAKLAQPPAERGLLSMAFPPDYATSGRFYVYYTAPRAGDSGGDVIVVAEYRRSADDPDRADPASERVVLAVDAPRYGAHNGGQLQFGPDGLLYLATGDGGGADDPYANAQNPASLLGKMLRIDPRVPGATPELYASGLRNPWRFSFDRATGDLVLGDVGQDAWEEVDWLPRGTAAGVNLGWPCREGRVAGPGTCAAGALTDPVLVFGHSGQGCSGAVTGGYVVRNHDLDSLYGRYVYSDFCGSDVRSLVLASPAASDDRSTGVVRDHVYSYGEDSCGHLYLARGVLADGDGEVDLLTDGAVTPCPEPGKPPVKPPPARDRTPPRLTVARRFRQRLQPHRSLYASVRCDERCAVTAAARIALPGRPRRVAVVRTLPSLAARRRVGVRLLLSDRAGRAVRRVLAGEGHVRAAIRVTARDAAGNRSVRARPVLVFP
jgi:glucose/arabinose dehydrogenase